MEAFGSWALDSLLTARARQVYTTIGKSRKPASGLTLGILPLAAGLGNLRKSMQPGEFTIDKSRQLDWHAEILEYKLLANALGKSRQVG